MNERFIVFQAFLFLFACALVCLGGASLFHYLSQDAAQFHTMQMLPDSSLSVLLVGTMLIAALLRRPWMLGICGMLAVALSLYTVSHNLLAGGADQGVSLVTGFSRSRTSWAVLSAIFVIAMMLTGSPKLRPWIRVVGIILASFGLLQGGYVLLDPDSSMAVGFKTSTEILACFVIVLMGAAIYIQSLMPAGNTLRLDRATVMLGIFSAVVAVCSWYAISRYQEQVLLRSSQSSLNSAEKSLERMIQARLLLIQRMGERWEAAGSLPGARVWEQESSSYLRDHPNLEFLALLDAGQAWLRFKGRDGDSERLARTLLDDDLSEYVPGHLQPDLARSLAVLGQQLGAYTVLIMPLQGVAEDLPYLVAGVDLQATLDDHQMGHPYNMVLRIARNGQHLHGPSAASLGDFLQIGTRPLVFGNDEHWQIDTYIKRQARAADSSHLATGVMAFMLLFGFLLMVSQRLRAETRERNRDLLIATAERDRDRRQLSESEQRYRSLYSSNPDPVFSVDVTGHYTGMNSAGLQLIGMSEAEVLNKHFTLGMHLDDEAMTRTRFASALNGEAQRFKVRIWARSGEMVELDVTILPILVNDEVTGVFGISKDLRAYNAARRDLEDALERSRRQTLRMRQLKETAVAVNGLWEDDALHDYLLSQLRSVVGAHQAGMSLVHDGDWSQSVNAVSLSDKYAAWHPFKGQLDGKGIYGLVCETNQPLRLTQAELEAHPRWQGVGASAAEHPPMNGWLAVPLIDRHGGNLGLLQLSDKFDGDFDEDDELFTIQFAQMVVTAMDNLRLIDEAVQANQVVREQNQFFSLSSEMLCMLSMPGRFVQVNPAFCSVLGYSADELIGSPYIDLIFQADRAAAEEAVNRLLRGEIISTLDLRVRHADNHMVWLELSAAVGADDLIYVVARNVTQQREYETTLARHQMLFQIAGQIARVGGWVYDLKSDELLLSDEVCALHGIRAGTVLKMEDVYRLYLPEYYDVLRESLEACIKEGKPYELKVQAVDALGGGMWVRLSAQPVLDQDGRTTHIQGALQDISPEIEAVENLEAMAERMRKILESVTDGFYALDDHWCFTYVNPQAELLLLSKAEDMFGRSIWELFPETASTELSRQYHEVMATGETRHFEYFYPPVQRWFDISVYFAEGGLAVFFRDISERKRHEQQLKKMMGELAHNASHDLLTGLPNRHIFEDRLRQCRELCLRYDRQMAVLFIDLDDFKPINDSLGHEVGDLVLQEVARRLEAAIRPGDTVARVGGDEFIVLLPDLAQEDDVLMVADRIMEHIARPCDMEGIRLQMTASIGITLADGNIGDPIQLIRQADLAMYKAKQLGRNHYQWFTEDMDQRILERLQMRADLQRAIENREFELYYQPQIAVGTGQLRGMEALLRWRHPERGMVPPDQFIPLAESTGQIVALSEWVMATACSDACRLREQGIGGYPVAVNVSPLHFQRAGFLSFVQGVLADSGLDPSLLELEVTEGLLLNNTDQAIATLASLKALGLKIAIDDFGTGFSSLGYLKRLPIDKIKIDKSFIDEVISDSRDAAIVQSIIGMAHNLQLTVVAEGVETPAQQAFLHRHDCDLIQGYLHARPMPFDDFAEWSRQRKL